jgi:hypothetical protein
MGIKFRGTGRLPSDEIRIEYGLICVNSDDSGIDITNRSYYAS